MKRALILAAFALSAMSCRATDVLTVDSYFRVSGTWVEYVISPEYVKKLPLTEQSWGPSRESPNGSTTIDIGSREVLVPGLGLLYLSEIRFTDGNIALLSITKLPSRPGNRTVTVAYKLHFVAQEAFWIEFNGDELSPSSFGSDSIYSKIDGPQKQRKDMVVNASRVRLRTSPGVDSGVVRLLEKGERVSQVLESKLQTRIGEQVAKWDFVISEKGDYGWVYGAYVSERSKEQ